MSDKSNIKIEREFKIQVTGNGTKEQIIQRLIDLAHSLDDHLYGNTQFEDETLYTEINEIE